MTYNFDPDRWLSLQLAALDGRRRRGALDEAGYYRERELLQKRHEQMLDGLDRSFDLPDSRSQPTDYRDSDG